MRGGALFLGSLRPFQPAAWRPLRPLGSGQSLFPPLAEELRRDSAAPEVRHLHSWLESVWLLPWSDPAPDQLPPKGAERELVFAQSSVTGWMGMEGVSGVKEPPDHVERR